MEQFLEFAGNHPLLFAAAGAVILALIVNELHGNLRGPRRLSPIEAVRLINDQDAIVIDVRAPADYKKGHLINAINIPVNRIGERRKELGKDTSRPLIVYCALGSVASTAVAPLKQAGFESVYVLRGGLNAWQQAGMPVTTRG